MKKLNCKEIPRGRGWNPTWIKYISMLSVKDEGQRHSVQNKQKEKKKEKKEDQETEINLKVLDVYLTVCENSSPWI